MIVLNILIMLTMLSGEIDDNVENIENDKNVENDDNIEKIENDDNIENVEYDDNVENVENAENDDVENAEIKEYIMRTMRLTSSIYIWHCLALSCLENECSPDDRDHQVCHSLHTNVIIQNEELVLIVWSEAVLLTVVAEV